MSISNFPEIATSYRLAVMAAIGIVVGHLLVRPIVRLPRNASIWPRWQCDACGSSLRFWQRIPLFPLFVGLRCRACPHRHSPWLVTAPLMTAVIFAGYTWLAVDLRCLDITEVRPPPTAFTVRIAFHLILFAFLVAATGCDLEDYVIPDAITVPGMAFAVITATCYPDLQVLHVWVDWSREHPINGPHIPVWIDQHRHWHGLTWSAAGLAAGAGLTWLVRIAGHWLLGRESLGFGDVTLMAMIGSFIGWQPIVFVFVLAPFLAMVAAVLVRVMAKQIILPYGPFLAASTLLVLSTWRWLWNAEFGSISGSHQPFRLRDLFGDAVSVASLGGMALAGLVGVLGLLRVYRSIPGKQRHEDRDSA